MTIREAQLCIQAAAQRHVDQHDQLTVAAWQGALWGRVEAKAFPKLEDVRARARGRRGKPLTLEQDVARWEAFFRSAAPRGKAN